MAKEFAIVTLPSGLTTLGTISNTTENFTANKTTGMDENGNVDAQNFNGRKRELSATLELTDRATAEALDIGASLTWKGFPYSFTSVQFTESNTGDPNTLEITAEYDEPTP